MIKTFFKTAWRNLNKYRSYSLINIFGLTLGISSCIVIFLIVQYELNYDRYNSKADRIYRVTLNAIDFNPSVSVAVANPMRTYFPELEAVSQTWFRDAEVKIGKTRYDEKRILFADEYYPSIFDLSWLQGNAAALKEPNNIVLTESYARKYFGNTSAMGQIMSFDNRFTLKVAGIIKDLPGNTHLPFDMMVSFATLREDVQGMMNQFYAIAGGQTYILTPPGYPIENIQKRIYGFVEKNWGSDIAKEAKLPLQPLTDIHFDQRYLNNTISYTTSRETYYVLAAVAFLIIVIASINFINLATAQAIRRAREVGVRKVLGSTRSQLIRQFLSETALLTIIALLLALLVTVAVLPRLSTWLDLKIDIAALAKPSTVFTILGLTTIVVMLAGLYPAFVQSAFRPVDSLKSRISQNFKGLTLRKGLVTAQFAISQIMIAGTLVVAYQMDFFQNRNLGYDKDAVVSFGIPDQAKSGAIKQALSQNPGVAKFSFSSGAPGINGNFTGFLSPEHGVSKSDVTEIKFVDESYTDMFELKMLAGQKIEKTTFTQNDTAFNVVVNETLINKLGIQDPQKAIGEHFYFAGNRVATIMGVVNDFQSESKHKKIRPCILIYATNNFYMASVKIQTSAMHSTIAAIEKTWTQLFPDNLFRYEFLDDHIANWYRQEQKEYTAFRLFSAIAILIGCLGLYGLVAFAAAQRIKEVGIRKVLGASIKDIVVLFSREFVLLIVIAFVIATPIAYYIMHSWLQTFAYRIDIGPGIFIIAIASSFMIAAVTISFQAIKAAVTNPLKSLRTE